jgi:hypothetical protein
VKTYADGIRRAAEVAREHQRYAYDVGETWAGNRLRDVADALEAEAASLPLEETGAFDARLIEDVAKAIRTQAVTRPAVMADITWDRDTDEELRDAYRDLARAAINASRAFAAGAASRRREP